MADSWVIGDTTYLGADYPFHAGITRELLRGNLDRLLDQSGYRYQSIAHGSDAYAEHTFAASDVYEDVTTEWGSWPTRVNYVEGSGVFRQLRVIISGRIVHASASAPTTVRLYALSRPRASLDPHSTSGLAGVTGYGDLVFSTSDWVVGSTTLTVNDASLVGEEAALSDSIPTTRYHELALHAIATSRATSLRLRTPTLEEVP